MQTALRPSVLKKDSLTLNIGEFKWVSQLLNDGDREGIARGEVEVEVVEDEVEKCEEAEDESSKSWSDTWWTRGNPQVAYYGHKRLLLSFP